MLFMLPVHSNHPFTNAGLFGVKRKYDIHVGLDIYCEEEAEVRSIVSGTVIEIIPFTGESAGSPWWNETQAIAIEAKNGTTFVYGEVTPLVNVGDAILPRQIIAKAKRVLKEDKGVNPTCMLHLELWEDNYQSNFTWKHGGPRPEGLVNPLKLFPFWVIKTPNGYKIETHDGQYWKYFGSAIDCKSYCMSRTEENEEKYQYINTPQLSYEYFCATGKNLTLHNVKSG